jgi:regulator of cell morphogenesis and NO signaling
MQISERTPLTTIVAHDHRAAEVFKRRGIDLCRMSRMTIAEAASLVGLQETILLRELQVVLDSKDPMQDLYNKLAPHDLIDHLVEYHHGFVRNQELPLRNYLGILVEDHGEEYPYLAEVAAIFGNLADHLLRETEKEELVLFPRIRVLSKQESPSERSVQSRFSICDLIPELVSSQDHLLDQADKLEEITSGFQTSMMDCPTFGIAMNSLREFVEDLRKHIHLERNVLFPKSIRFDRELREGIHHQV